MNTPQLPDYLKNKPYQSVGDQLGGSLGAGAPPYLSIMGGRFTLVDSAGNESPINTVANGIPYVDVVVIDSLERQSKIYYGADRAFDSNNFAPPKCFSDNGIAPSRGASQPQSPTCASCEKGAWGSAVSKVDPKRKTKACADYQKLALLVPGNEGIYLLRVPPNSLRPLREYTARFRGTGTDISDIITRVSFEKDVLGTLNFTGVSYIDQMVAEKRNEIRQKALTDAIVGRLDQPIQGLIGSQAPAQTPLIAGQPQEAPPFQPLPPQEAPPASPSPSRGRGRPKKAANGPQDSQQGPIAPPFPMASTMTSNPNPGQFGIAPGQTPSEELNKTLTDFFGK